MITIDTIRERLAKLEADVVKKEDRINKLEQRRQKLMDKCRQLGLTPIDDIQYKESRYHNKYGTHFYDEFDIDVLDEESTHLVRNSEDFEIRSAWIDLLTNVQNIVGAKNKMIELEEKIKDNEERLEKMTEKEEKLYDMPPLFLELIDAMIPECEKSIEYIYEHIRQLKATGTPVSKLYKAFGSDYDKAMAWDKNEIRQLAERRAQAYVSDLYRRVTKKVGDIVDYHDLYLNGPAINGVVVGEKGTTRLETIMAGGYNIQRLHLRVILH